MPEQVPLGTASASSVRATSPTPEISTIAMLETMRTGPADHGTERRRAGHDPFQPWVDPQVVTREEKPVTEFDETEARALAASMDRAIYYVYLLKKGPAWSPDSTPETTALQDAHLDNLRRLGEEGKLVLNGPLLDSLQLGGEVRGIGVLRASSLAEARAWISTDPMVKVGRLVFELHAWMIAKGILP
jgi:uncharacterized protein YciI